MIGRVGICAGLLARSKIFTSLYRIELKEIGHCHIRTGTTLQSKHHNLCYRGLPF